MISILALVVGLAGMLGFWALAWQIWLQAEAMPPNLAGARDAAGWRNEPTPDQATPSVTEPLCSALPWPPAGSAEIAEPPVMREHSSSGANTTFFNRVNLEKTEILHEEDILEGPTPAKKVQPLADPPPATGTRKTKPFRRPDPPAA